MSTLLEPWKIMPNATFSAVIICLDDEGNEINITGCQARMDFKTKIGTQSQSLFSLTESDGLTLASEDAVVGTTTYHNGVIRLIVTPEKAALTEGFKGCADLLIKLSDASVYRVYVPPRSWIAQASVTPAVFS